MKIVNFFALLVVCLSLVNARAQTESEESSSVRSSSDQRPEMPNLFFRKEQRRVLEAVRQGVVEEEDFDIDEFVPVVIIEDALPEEIEEETRQRGEDLSIDAYIVNRNTGSKVLWVNGKQIDLQEDSEYLTSRGIVVNADDVEGVADSLRIENGVVKADDAFSNAKFEAKVGQVIGAVGGVEESLPVVIVKSR